MDTTFTPDIVAFLIALAAVLLCFVFRPRRRDQTEAAHAHEALGDEAEHQGDTVLAVQHWRHSALTFQVWDCWDDASRVCHKVGNALQKAGDRGSAFRWHGRSARLAAAAAASRTGNRLRVAEPGRRAGA